MRSKIPAERRDKAHILGKLQKYFPGQQCPPGDVWHEQDSPSSQAEQLGRRASVRELTKKLMSSLSADGTTLH